MSEMVERVARAMAIVDKGDDMWDIVSEDGDGYGYVGKNEYRAMARAAIAAMREPTAAMVREGGQAIWEDVDEASRRKPRPDDNWPQDEAKAAWSAMLGEALK